MRFPAFTTVLSVVFALAPAAMGQKFTDESAFLGTLDQFARTTCGFDEDQYHVGDIMTTQCAGANFMRTAEVYCCEDYESKPNVLLNSPRQNPGSIDVAFTVPVDGVGFYNSSG